MDAAEHASHRSVVLLSLWAGVSLLVLFASRDGTPDRVRRSREPNYYEAISRLETDLAQARRREAVANYLRYLALAEHESEGGDPQRGRELLDLCPVDQRHWEWYYLRDRLRNQGKNDAVFTSALPVASVDLSYDGQYLAIGGGGRSAE